MLRKLISQNSIAYQCRWLSAQAKPAIKEKYDIFAGVLIERLPIVSKKFNEIESEVMTLLNKVEFENSLKCDHELRKEKEKRQAQLLKSGKTNEKEETEARALQTAQDFEDMAQDELAKFVAAPRVTEDDKKNNVKSLDRKLDDTLVFLCEHKLGKDNVLLLPQGKWTEGETLRQTAERIVSEKCGSDLKVHFYGNAPVGFYRYKYPSPERKDSVGAKVFFFRAIYKGGNVADPKQNFMWINEDEMKEKVKDVYYDAVKQFLCS